MERTTHTLAFSVVGVATTVFIATGVAALVVVSLRELPFFLGIDVTSAMILIDSIAPIIRGLLPLISVFLYAKYAEGDALSPWLVGLMSLPATVLGRYIGSGFGYILLGRPFPTPLVLVSSADLAAREFGILMWTGVVFGVLAAGLWGMLGAFGGIGLAQSISPTNEP